MARALDITDEDLIKQAIPDFAEVYLILEGRYQYLIRFWARNAQKKHRCLCFDDLLQEAKTAFFQAICAYYPALGSFINYAHRRVHYALKEAVRQAYRQIPVELLELDDEVQTVSEIAGPSLFDPDRQYRVREATTELHEVYHQASTLEQQVWGLFHEGNSYRMIAEQLGITTKDVDNCLYRLRLKFDAAIKKVL